MIVSLRGKLIEAGVLRVVIDGYTQAEAGQQLGLSEPAARKRFQRALTRLRDQAEQKI